MTRRSIFREPLWILATWCVFCVWVVGYCSWQYLPVDGPDGAKVVAANATEEPVASVVDESAPADSPPADDSPADDSRDVPQLALVGGLPSWVFWGIALPWCMATGFSIVFALYLMDEETLDV